MLPRTIVIVGAGLTGGSAAAALRAEGFDGTLVLIGAEREPPYERPPLSKQYLRGEMPFEKTLVHPADFYRDNAVETLFGTRADRVDPVDHAVVLDGGRRVRYDALLVATGGRNRRLPIPGIDLDGVFDLRTVEDADRLRDAAARGRRAVVVGMGFIGSEVTASLRTLGVAVTVLERGAAPLARVLGEQVGGVLAAAHSDHGVKMLFGDQVASFEGTGRVERVTTAGGRRLECDFAVVGLGIEPVTDVVTGSGIRLENGIVVDEFCRTEREGIFAAGDVANHYHPVFGRHIRVEHWQNALKHGPAAARNMLGREMPYDEIPWFWSDQYDVNLQYAGYHAQWDDLVIRGSLEARSFVAFYLNAGRVDAVVALNRGRDLRRAMPLIRSRATIAPAALRDEAVDPRTLVSSA